MRHEIDAYHRTLAGTKRKRVVSGAENTASGRGSRVNRNKRRKATHGSSDDEVTSSMEVDDQSHWEASDNSEGEEDVDSSDNYLINEAHPRQLLRLRKDELVRLYIAAGLADDAELFTKPEIVDSIIAARDDVAELPPSSPPTAYDSGSSDYSSDGGNVAGGEETDYTRRSRNGLRRRATMADTDMNHTSRPRPADRCISLGQIDPDAYATKRARYQGIVGPARAGGPLTRRRGTSNASSSRSSPTTSAVASLPSPPATRMRTRKSSNEQPLSPSSSSGKNKGKSKQVEFSEEVQVNEAASPNPFDDESDLTDLTEVEESIAAITPSPRRLRSKGERSKVADPKGKARADEDIDVGKRVTPMRKAKKNAVSLAEDNDEEEEDQLESDVEQEDQLASPLATPKAARRTTVKRRLRPRRIQTHTPPSDGDDEQSADEDADESIDGDEEESSEDDGTTIASDESFEEEEAPAEARVLRNGKVVGDGEADEESIGTEDEEDEEDEETQLSAVEEVEVDVEAAIFGEGSESEEEEDEEPMADDVDLTIATVRSLIRLRRDDLVRLCETREIDATGTKPQLADALLQWRDQHCSSPSSTGTVRPPSTMRPRANGKRKSKSASKSPPVLERSNRVHLDEPRTPPVSGRSKPSEPELELDLESLGLEDREIPSDKLTKLEKIGSGGFKDVYIGKFKGRRVAIAEFRGQLSEMDIKELKLLGDFNHPNIVKFLGVSIPENTKETPVMIVSELCSNGDLFDYVRNVNPPSLYRVLSIMLDIAHGLAYLHARKPSIIHRDCKSSNILITSRGVAKITDFGLAKVKQSTRSMVRSLVGTVNWQAPELWHPHPKYNHKVDVFSCAMVFWEMLQWHLPNKKFPWEGMNEHAIYDIVGHKRQRPSTSGLRKQWCPEIVDLMERMWAHEPNDRPTMPQVVKDLEEIVRKYR
ncbi:hypothetical protein FOMPIDRAFT_1025916 [Fomitopsis schrenkii]|uniref:Protein kinase domain-containing protein n=1 Tax=Fomitopsis schrenkii TaxID=2126942 RepID=S8DP84_FOMSC|nr:hypothetical protein FOMPIDRAFT_1025916 [Fomitopsis schrenkii]